MLSKVVQDSGISVAHEMEVLRYASKWDNVDILEQILRKHDQGLSHILSYDFGTSDPEAASCSLLRLAVRDRAVNVVELLISYGADVHEVNICGETLSNAIFNLRRPPDRLIEVLLDSGLTFSLSDIGDCMRYGTVYQLFTILDTQPDCVAKSSCEGSGDSVWHLVMYSGRLDIFKFLQAQQALTPAEFLEAMSTLNGEGYAPFHLAASCKTPEILQELIKTNMPMHLRTAQGASVLHIAAQCLIDDYTRNRSFMKLLIDAGATMDSPDDRSLLRDQTHGTALDLLLDAIFKENVRWHNSFEDDIMLLLSTLSSPTLLSYQYESRSLISWAIDLRLTSTFRFLLHAGADVDRTERTMSQGSVTPLECLVLRSNDSDLLRETLANSRAFQHSGNHQRSLLHIALSSLGGEIMIEDTCRLLLESGHNPNARWHDNLKAPAIVAAASLGKAGIVKLLIEHGANVNACDTCGVSALMASARSGRLYAARHLTSSSAELIATRSAIDTVSGHDTLLGPAELAAYNGHLEIIQLLLPHRDQYTTQVDVSPLWIACLGAQVHVVDFLLQYGEPVDAVHAVTGSSLLHAAARSGSKPLIHTLIKTGREFAIHDSSGRSPVDYATLAGHGDVVELLDQYEDLWWARQISKTSSRGIARGFSHDAAVIRAVKNNSKSKLLTLYKSGWDPNEKLSCGACSPLMLAMLEGHIEICAFLIDCGVSADITSCYKHGLELTIWNLVVSQPSLLTVLEMLLRREVTHQRPRRMNLVGDFKLHHASSAGNDAAVKLLLAHGAQVDHVDANLHTPLLIAALHGYEAILKMLIEAGANVNTRDCCGETALKLAARKGHIGIHYPMPRWRDTSRSYNYWLLVGFTWMQNPRTDTLQDPCLSAEVMLAPPLMLYMLANQLDDFRQAFRPQLEGRRVVQVLRKYPASCLYEDLNTRAAFDDGDLIVNTALYFSVLRGLDETVERLLTSSALLNLEGGEEGIPLMAACALGRLSLVKLLIRFGATEYYIKDGVVFSALEAAHHFPNIQHWFLVDRYTDQPKLMHTSLNIPDETTTRPASSRIGYSSFMPWSAFDRTLVFEEDWPAYLKKMVPPSTRSFICLSQSLPSLSQLPSTLSFDNTASHQSRASSGAKRKADEQTNPILSERPSKNQKITEESFKPSSDGKEDLTEQMEEGICTLFIEKLAVE